MASKEGVISTLSPIERKILPHLERKKAEDIAEAAKTDITTVLRALEFLSNKGIVRLSRKKHTDIIPDVNGVMYIKDGLPERKLLDLFSHDTALSLEDAKKKSELSDNEFQAALGALKKKALIRMESGKLFFEGKREEIVKKMMEEMFLSQLPLSVDSLQPEQKFCFEQLKNRKAIVRVKETTITESEITPLGREIMKEPLKASYIEQLTPDMLGKGTWKGKSFRKYDLKSPVPRIHGGKRQPYYSFLKQVREKLVALGFEEMHGSLVETEFWNYDALFQPQFHVAREWSSTYYIKNKIAQSTDKKLIERVKHQHEKSWNYKWKLENALRLILRPQGTVLSARKLPEATIPGKYFAIARCYRPDVIDSQHLSEFNQVEGIIVQENLTMKNLFAILELFAKEIANAKDIRFVPSYFPFTEPSVELHVKHEKFGWMELGGAGIFRREVVKSLTGKDVTVLAWGLGIDRLAMLNLGIDDIRMLFSQDLDFLRS